MSERQIVRIATPITEGNDSGYRMGYADEMQPGDVLHESEAATILHSVGNAALKVEHFLKAEAETVVDFAERITRHFAPMFASLTGDEQDELTARLADLKANDAAPAKETAAQKKARLAAEKAAEAPPAVEPAPPAPEPAPEPAPVEQPAAEAPAPAPEPVVLPAPAPVVAPGWGTPAS